MYNFTTLGASGKDGPNNNAGYIGTGLQNVQVKDGKQEWTVPFTGRFSVEACGASGGNGFNKDGGKGAKVSGDLTLNKGQKLIVLVGQKGYSQDVHHPGSGGGGTFVFLSSQGKPLLVAGGGGGGGKQAGFPGNDHLNASGSNGAGSNGEGGFVCKNSDGNALEPGSGSGGGIYGNGGCFESGKSRAKIKCNEGGESFSEGGKGGDKPNCNGGFGGGGACDSSPGGGGGYSGGGVDPNTAGGGGGSFADDVMWSIVKGGCNEGHGYASFISED